jgi:TolB-like protein
MAKDMDESARQWTANEQALVRTWLQRVLTHALFTQAVRQQSLLQFIVEAALDGRAHLLKGYTLGVEVFGRGTDFDPVADSIVRVEVARLRSKLVEYYAGDGRGDAVVFELPKGGYAPIIHWGSNKAETPPSFADSKPSLAVLPFINVSDDLTQSYFADGLTDDLITDISKLSGLFVISRQSAFVYRNSAQRAEEIATELGVRYLLTGSVRRAGERMRITAQLVDAQNGIDLWAERYDRDAGDIFDVQDDVARCIVDALQVRLSNFERERLGHEGTKSVEAHDTLLRGLSAYWKYSREACAEAQGFFRRALEIDPDYAVAHAWMARSYVLQWSMGWSIRSEESLDPALAHARRAVELDDLLPLGHSMLGWVYLWQRHPEAAIAEERRACALNPNDADARLFLSYALSAEGNGEEALYQIEIGMRLNPHPSTIYLHAQGQAYFAMGNDNAAIACFYRGIEINPAFLANHAYLAILHTLLEQPQLSATAAENARKLCPGPLPNPMFTNPELRKRWDHGYRQVGFDRDVRS